MTRAHNAGREISFALLAAALFAIGLGMYILSSNEDAKSSAKAGLSEHPAEPSETPPELAAAQEVVDRFAAALAAKRYEDAYASMAAPYRAGHPLDAFRRSCERSPLLASAQRGAVLSIRRQILGAGAPGPYSEQARGVLVTASGSIDATFTLLVDGSDVRILVLSLAGVPVLDGVSPAAAH